MRHGYVASIASSSHRYCTEKKKNAMVGAIENIYTIRSPINITRLI